MPNRAQSEGARPREHAGELRGRTPTRPLRTAAYTAPSVLLFRALHDALPADAIAVDEIVCQIDSFLHFLFESKPIEQIRGLHGALGTSLGVALGAKVARPDRLVVCVIGDGAWHYNPMPVALGFAHEHRTPLLIVVCNNGQYGSQTANVRKFYPDGAAVAANDLVGNVIAPMPKYDRAADGYGGAGERVSRIADLAGAIERGLASVPDGRTYVLDVVVDP